MNVGSGMRLIASSRLRRRTRPNRPDPKQRRTAPVRWPAQELPYTSKGRRRHSCSVHRLPPTAPLVRARELGLRAEEAQLAWVTDEVDRLDRLAAHAEDQHSGELAA